MRCEKCGIKIDEKKTYAKISFQAFHPLPDALDFLNSPSPQLTMWKSLADASNSYLESRRENILCDKCYEELRAWFNVDAGKGGNK